MKVVITRPQIDAELMASQLEALGVSPIVAPLMSVKSVDSELPSLDDYQALIVTSANGARALGRRTKNRNKCLFAVGAATASVARKLKFEQVIEADGDVVSLAGVIRRHADPLAGPLLHVTGSVVAGDLASDLSQSGFKVDRIVLYEAVAAHQVPAPLAEALTAAEDAAFAFFSPRTARIFIELAQEANLLEKCQNKVAVCLSDAVAEVLGPYFGALRIARDRSTASMMDLIRKERDAG